MKIALSSGDYLHLKMIRLEFATSSNIYQLWGKDIHAKEKAILSHLAWTLRTVLGGNLLELHCLPASFALPWGLMPRAQLPSAHAKAFASLSSLFFTRSLENRMRSIGPSVPAGSQGRLICGQRDDAWKQRRFMRERNSGQGPWLSFSAICLLTTTQHRGWNKLLEVIRASPLPPSGEKG